MSPSEECELRIREEALRQANVGSGALPAEIVERARAFYEFLKGDASAPQPTAARKPMDIPRF